MSDSSHLQAIEEAANIACACLLPEKSKFRYNETYNAFSIWYTSRNIQDVNETVMLGYFKERSEARKSPSSLWCEYSMLKLTSCQFFCCYLNYIRKCWKLMQLMKM